MRVAVLGAAGQMGKWLVQYLTEHNHTLTLADKRKEELNHLNKSYHAKIAENDIAAVKGADLVLISVPLENTVQVISSVASYLQTKSIVVEISSVKSGIIESLRKLSISGTRPVSLHPLFGPAIGNMQKKMVLVPVVDLIEEKKLARILFPDAQLIVVDSDSHDKAMAIVLSLSYMMNMTLASVLVAEDIKLLKRLSGTTFELQLLLTQSIMVQLPELHISLGMTNKYAPLYLQRFLKRMTKLSAWMETGKKLEFQKEYRLIQKTLSQNLDLNAAYQEMYRLLQHLEESKC